VRQRVLVALGTTDDPIKALANLRAELEEARGRRRRSPERDSKTAKAAIGRLDGRIKSLATRVKELDRIIKSGSLDRRQGRA